jgi:TonB family protein
MRSFEVVMADHPDFVAAVREGLPEMRFYPAKVGERKVKQLVQMPFSFSLVNNGSPTPQAAVGKPATPRNPSVLYEVPADDSMPRVIDGVPPVYPNQLRAANIQGMVQATFVVRADGKVDMGTFMIRRSDHEAFSTAVRAAVEKMTFRPATKDGKPVSKMMSMPFMFTLAR